MTIYNDTLTDVVAAGDAMLLTYNQVAPEGFKSFDLVLPIFAQSLTVSDGVNLTESAAAILGLVLLDNIRISQSDTPNQKSNISVSEAAAFVDRLIRSMPLTVEETVTVAQAEVAQLAAQVIDALRIADTIAPALLYNLSLVDGIRVADTLTKFLGADALDALTVVGTMEAVAGKGGQITETITIAETLTPLFVLRVIAEDSLQIADSDAVRMIFNGELTDAIEITGMYVGPNGSVTTWAMNTRTAGTTEYQNYAFNSFARLGNKYIGASQDGLYELLGDDDDGTNIIATIRSGFAQWAGTHLGSFKAAYLAVRGEGDFVLRVLTADGKTYNYRVTAQSMKTVKVNMGKGLRARYFAFELISSGQDFDLDTLEFIPLVAQRRV